MMKIMMMVVIAMVMIESSGLEKKKEKNKMGSKHLVGVIIFKIDSRTIKRGETHPEMRLSKCH